MFKTIRVFAYGISKMIGYLPVYNKVDNMVKEGKLKEAEELFIPNYVDKALSGILKRAEIEVEVNGEENIPKEGACVFVANHQSQMDAVAMMYAVKRRVGFVAKNDLEKVPLLNKWMKLMGTTFVDRKNPRQALKDIEEATMTVMGGTPMCVYPEGTRSKTNEMLPFKTGVFKIIERAKVPVIPVSIDGTRDTWENNGNKFKKGKIVMTFSSPIDTKDYEKKDFRELPEKVKQIILENRIK